MKITGPIFALLTPFNEKREINFPALKDYLAFLEEKGVKNVISGGTTGEFPSLKLEERVALLEFCREYFSGRILFNISATNADDCGSLMAQAAGKADGLLILPPFYFADPPEEGILDFFNSVLSGCTQPVFVYHFPKHTGVHMDADIIRKLAHHHDNICGIKDSSGDLNLAKSYKEIGPDFQVFVGKDTHAFEVLESGLNGNVTGTGNCVPEFHVRIFNAFHSGTRDEARRLQPIYNRWNQAAEAISSSGIAIAKAVLNQRLKGFPLVVRPPLTPLKKDVAAGCFASAEAAVQTLTDL